MSATCAGCGAANAGGARFCGSCGADLAGDWLSTNRVTSTTTAYVGPGEVGWFEFTVRAPAAAGDYQLALRGVVDGIGWLEDDGIFFTIHAHAPLNGRSSLSFVR